MYKTVLEKASAELIVKNSRFISYIAPVSSKEEADSFIDNIKKMNRGANHNVYAYILRENNYQKHSDDGEPGGTGGMPVLKIIEGAELVDTIIVVTRYFGGVLLGTGGLSRAYGECAKKAFEASQKAEMRFSLELRINANYDRYSMLCSLIAEFSGKITDTDFSDTVTISFFIDSEFYEAFQKKLTETSGGKIVSEKIGEKFIPYTYN